MHLRPSEHLVKTLKSLRCLGEYAHAAYRPVETVRKSHKDFPRLRVSFRYIRLKSLAETLVAGLVGLDYLAYSLVNHQQVVIFKKNPGLEVPDFII